MQPIKRTFVLVGLLCTALVSLAEEKTEPLLVTFSAQLTVTNIGLTSFGVSATGQSIGRDGSEISGNGVLANLDSFYLTLTDADGDKIAFDLVGTQHPFEYSDLVSLGYYDVRMGGVYTVNRFPTGKYAGLHDKGTFIAQLKFYPAGARGIGQPFGGEGTLTLMGSTPIQPLPIKKKR